MRWAGAVVALLFSGNAALAAGAAYCDAYVKNALIDVRNNQTLNCGYTGTRWSPDPNVHRRWCNGALQQSVFNEDDTRKNAIGFCQTCRAYANQAAAAEDENLKLGCGFGGDAWESDPARHFSWCMGLSLNSFPTAKDQQTALRAKALETCRAQRVQQELNGVLQKGTLRPGPVFKPGG